MPDQRLQNKVIVIVGGTSGLGLSAAQACVVAGAAVVAVGRSQQECDAAESVLGDRAPAAFRPGTHKPGTAEAAIHTALSAFRGFHALYHVAGGSGRSQGDGPLESLSEEGWEFTLELNLKSVFLSNRAAVRQFLAQATGGSVLNLTSVLAGSPSPRYFATHAYAAAKAAVIGLTRSAAAYYAPHAIRSTPWPPRWSIRRWHAAIGDDDIVHYVRTKQPLDGGRVGRPSDTDDAVVYFLSDESRFVTGQVLHIDGGWTLTDGQYCSS